MTTSGAVLAVDVGGTTIRAAVLAPDGAESLRRTVPTPFADGPDAVVAAIRDLTAERVAAAAAAGTAVQAAGVVVPGVVDPAAGVARYAANIGWADVPLRDIVTDASRVPTAIGHDVRSAGLAELRVGAAQGVSDALIVVLGTGVAAVVVAGGTVVQGATGIPGEIGHIPVGDPEIRCRCGAFGCLEMFASARGIARTYAERTGRELESAAIVQRLDDDPDAFAVWLAATQILARGLVCAALITDTARIVLSGGLSQAGGRLRVPTAQAFAAGLPWRTVPEIVSSPLGGRAGIVGAGLLARDALEARQ